MVVATEPSEFVTVARRGTVVTALRASEASEPVTEATTELAPAGKLARAEVRMGSAAGTLLAPAKPGEYVSER